MGRSAVLSLCPRIVPTMPRPTPAVWPPAVLFVWLPLCGLLARSPDAFAGDSPGESASGLVSTAVGGDLDRYRWPEFRGPLGNGFAVDEAEPPTRWSERENVIWKREIEGRGWSSPVVWEGTAWLTAATEEGHSMWATAIDLSDGRELWRTELFENEQLQETHFMNSFASPTPVTDGERLWVHFGSYGTACLDARSGEVLWKRRDFPCYHHRGPGSSPILWKDKLIIHFDGFDLQYVVALDPLNGETIWNVDRDVEYGTDNGDVHKAFATPIVIDVDGQTQLISPTSKAVLAYDPENGKELWRATYDEFSTATRPVWDGKNIFVNTGFPNAKLHAVDPRGAEDESGKPILWTNRTGIGSKSSQLIFEGLIYNVHDAGVATCIDASTGETVWRERLDGKFSASPILAGGRIYLFDHDGTAHVLEPGRSFERVAKNSLDDGCMASPVPLGTHLLVRTRSALYLLGNSDLKSTGTQ